MVFERIGMGSEEEKKIRRKNSDRIKRVISGTVSEKKTVPLFK